MKTKIFYCLLFMGSLIMACEKTELDELMPHQQGFFPIGLEAIPENIVQLSKNFPGSSILKAEQHPELGFKVLMHNRLQIVFDANGNFLFSQKQQQTDTDEVIVAVEDLPADLLAFIRKNYPHLQILWAEFDKGRFNVYLNNGWELYFDRNGAFLSAEHNDELVDLANLPPAITEYIRNNFPGVNIVKAEFDEGRFNLYLSNGWELYFDANGNFLRAERDDEFIDPANLPAEIKDYIHNNYPDASIVKAEFDDGRYEILLDNKVELYFDRNGNFLFSEID
jgi:hypothetical protein